MYYSSPKCSIKRLSLETDDILGMQTIYGIRPTEPGTSIAPTPAPTPVPTTRATTMTPTQTPTPKLTNAPISTPDIL